MNVTPELTKLIETTLRGRKRMNGAHGTNDHENRSIADKKAIAALMKKHPEIKKAYAERARIAKLYKKPNELLTSFGLSHSSWYINDVATFIERLGYDHRPTTTMIYDPNVVISRLASAETEEVGKAILKEYGIFI